MTHPRVRFAVIGIQQHEGSGWRGWLAVRWAQCVMWLGFGAVEALIEAAYEDGFDVGYQMGVKAGMHASFVEPPSGRPN